MWSYDVGSGIRHNDMLLWVKAARWHGLTWKVFCDLDGDEQSFLVAAYLTVVQCEAVETKEATQK